MEKNHKIIIVLLVIIIILLAGVLIYVSGILTTDNNELELETYDFGHITMSVPKGSNFTEYDSVGKGTSYWSIGYTNNNDEIQDLNIVWIGNYKPSNDIIFDYIETDGDMEIYNAPYGNKVIDRHVGDYYVSISGMGDIDNLKEMAKSIKVNSVEKKKNHWIIKYWGY